MRENNKRPSGKEQAIVVAETQIKYLLWRSRKDEGANQSSGEVLY